jgi:NAD(P)H-quinone oxidoreductase subunit 5
MNTTQSLLPLAVIVAPAGFGLAAVVAWQRPGRHPRAVERAGVAAAVVGLLTATGAVLALITGGSATSPTLGVEGLGLSLRLDPVSVTVFAMVTILAAVVFRYSATYLDGDEHHGAFLGRIAATVAAVEVLVLAGNLLLLLLAWIATSLALHRLLLFRGNRPRARLAARKKFVVARIGDGLLLTAVVIVYARYGTGDFGALSAAITSQPAAGWSLGALTAAAVCLAAAACLKSAQFPTHGWLVELMETPTPVSALLHAGILNAGPFLVIRCAYLVDGAAPATTLLIVVGACTAAFASVVLLTQPSVKVALAYSSAAHMGFMLMVCGMGFYPAAMLHLVAHSFYKAHAFLSSGSVIDEARAHGVRLPRRLGRPSRIAASALVALCWYALLAWVFRIDPADQPLVLAVGAILVLGTTQLVAPAIDSDGPVAGATRASLLALLVTVSFFTLEEGAHLLLRGAVPEAVARDPLQLALMAGVVVAFAAIVLGQIREPTHTPTARQRALVVHLRNGFYANAVFDRLVGALRITPPAVTTSVVTGPTAIAAGEATADPAPTPLVATGH